MADTRELSSKAESEENPFVSFLEKLKLKFPSNNSDEETKVVAVQDKRSTVSFLEKPKPAVVSEPLNIQTEDQKTTNPAVLWQVYALGGFLILRWVWGRWNERKAPKGPSGDQGSDDDQECDAQD